MNLLVKLELMIFLGLTLVGNAASAFDWPTSGRSEGIRNPFVALGFDPATNNLSGYVSATRIAPGNTDECAFVFFGNISRFNKLTIAYLNGGDAGESDSYSMGHADITADRDQLILRVNKSTIQGDCEWILPFVGEPGIHESAQELLITLGGLSAGNWVGIYAIKTPRAHFHRLPNESSVQRSFVVKGDIVYVYKRNADWSYVKYEKRGRTTEGWLRTSDLLFGIGK
ncbi:MAG: hypothetical protein AB1584_04000 [Pseudomonadota bacterium]